MTSNYRGAVVEDLQLSPALVLPSTTSVGVALRMAFERDFSILPISDPATRSLEGWVDIATLKSDLEAGRTREESSLGQLHGDSLRSFPKKTQAYTVITPDTPLEELEVFLDKDGVSFALVTDGGRKFVLGLVTRDDLQKFNLRRNPNAAAASS